MSPRVAEPAAFDITGPLPAGVTVLEASAGTGKTYTIAALAARYVAEGTPLDQILLVTFTRMATGELRDRVRERLVHTEQGLARRLAGAPPSDADEVVALLASGPEDEVRERHARLARALARFDAATIATTHGFCQEVLGGLGIVGDVETDMTFVEDPADLVEEVVDDLFVRRFHRHGDPQFSRAEALRIARIAVDNPAARIEPDGAPENSIAAMRVRFARVVCAEFERRKRRMSLITYEDLLTRLKDTLDGPGGEAAAERLRARYRVVLVDEFQDTDPVQWDIMRLAFGGGGVALVLIGDPKQAIYAFRGADVYAYLKARSTASTEATLEVNWRSDQGLIDAYDALFVGATLGHKGIVYRRVRAAPSNQLPGLIGAPVAAPVRVRVVHRDEPSITRTPSGYAQVASVREHIASDLAGDLVALLSSGAEVEIRSGGGGAGAVSPRAGLRRPRRGARAHAPQRRAGPRRAGSRRHPGGHQRRGQRVRDRPGARLAARAGGDRAAGFLGSRAVGRADPVPRLDGCACGGRRRGGLGGGAPEAASLGAGAAHERCRGADGDGDAGGGAARPGAGDGRRRACADRPAPRRAAAARDGDGRGDGRRGADGVAAPADRGGGARDGRRGAHAAAGVRRRGRPGADDPPQQRAWSSRSSTARTCGSPATSRATRSRCSSTIRRRTTRGRSTSGWTGRTGGAMFATTRRSRGGRTCGWRMSR